MPLKLPYGKPVVPMRKDKLMSVGSIMKDVKKDSQKDADFVKGKMQALYDNTNFRFDEAKPTLKQKMRTAIPKYRPLPASLKKRTPPPRIRPLPATLKKRTPPPRIKKKGGKSKKKRRNKTRRRRKKKKTRRRKKNMRGCSKKRRRR